MSKFEIWSYSNLEALNSRANGTKLGESLTHNLGVAINVVKGLGERSGLTCILDDTGACVYITHKLVEHIRVTKKSVNLKRAIWDLAMALQDSNNIKKNDTVSKIAISDRDGGEMIIRWRSANHPARWSLDEARNKSDKINKALDNLIIAGQLLTNGDIQSITVEDILGLTSRPLDRQQVWIRREIGKDWIIKVGDWLLKEH